MRKTLPVRWSRDAIDHLNVIHNYIKKKSPKNAKHVAKTLLNLGDSLGEFPEKYPREPLLENNIRNLRSVSKWSYKIVFEVTNDLVIIVKIFDTSTDPKKIHKAIGKDAL